MGTRPKCLNRGWFRQSIFKKMPLQTDPLCNSANPRPTYQPETSLPIPILHQSSNPMTILQSRTCPPKPMVNAMPIRGHLHKYSRGRWKRPFFAWKIQQKYNETLRQFLYCTVRKTESQLSGMFSTMMCFRIVLVELQEQHLEALQGRRRSKTLPEAQRSQGIESLTWEIFFSQNYFEFISVRKMIQVIDSTPWARCASGNVSPSIFQLIFNFSLFFNFHFISSNFGHQVASNALVPRKYCTLLHIFFSFDTGRKYSSADNNWEN